MKKIATIALMASSSLAFANPNTTTASTTEPLKKATEGGISITPLAGISYERIATSAKDSEPLAGLGLSAKAKVSAGEYFGFVPFVQAGLSWASVGNQVTYKPLPGVTQDITSDLSAAALAADLGAQLKVDEAVTIDLSLGYSASVYGKFKLVDKTSTSEKTTTQTLEKFSNLNVAARGLGQISPGFDVGVEATYKVAGVFKAKDATENKFSGYALGLVSLYSF